MSGVIITRYSHGTCMAHTVMMCVTSCQAGYTTCAVMTYIEGNCVRRCLCIVCVSSLKTDISDGFRSCVCTCSMHRSSLNLDVDVCIVTHVAADAGCPMFV